MIMEQMLLVVYHHLQIMEYGVASIGWSIKLMGVNASDDDGFVTDGYSGILAAAQMGADVINMSWGGFGGG